MSVCREKCPLISWLENMKRQIFKSVFLWTEVCPCYRLNLNMIRQRWKSIIIWNIIYSEDAPPYISALPAEAGMWARASQFPPDYNDGGSYLFSPAVRLYSFFFLSLSFSRQKLQLLLMTGNLKVPLLNSHRCHVVRIKQTRSANSWSDFHYFFIFFSACRKGAHTKVHSEWNAVLCGH